MKSSRYSHLGSMLAWLTLALLSAPANSNELQFQHFLVGETCGAQLFTIGPMPCPNLVIRVQAPGPAAGPADIGQWHLVRTPGPTGGHEVVSIMHTGDVLRSDADFAGLMIRCREKSSLQIGLVVIRPFPPKAHPQVSIVSGTTNIRLQASVLPAGIVLTLPNEAEVLAKGPWQSLNQVSFGIEGDGVKINGIVPLENLRAALAFLQSNCGDQ